MSTNIKDYLMSKSIEWRDENEYRLVVLSKTKNKEYFHDISNSLKAVILGNEMNHIDQDAIMQLCQGKLKVYKIDHRYWKSIIFRAPYSSREANIMLDGLHFNMNTPCYYVHGRVRDSFGKEVSICVDTESGEVKVLK